MAELLENNVAATRGPVRHRFTVDEFYRLGEAEAFHPEARIELIDGELMDMAPIGSRHSGVLGVLTRLLVAQTAPEIAVHVQSPIRLDAYNEPIPDLTLLRPRDLPYTEAHPGPEDVLLLIEVADSSLAYDRDRKLPLYARCGIAETWLLDLRNRRLAIHREPAPEGYRNIHHPSPRERVSPSLLPGVVIDLGQLFG